MNSDLSMREVIPANSAMAYPGPLSGFSDEPIAEDILVSAVSAFDKDNNGKIDSSLESISKGGGTVGVVDWVLVQLRLVPQGTPVPDDLCLNDSSCKANVRIVTKVALLLTDGTVSFADADADADGDVDADDLAIGVLVFDRDEVNFDPVTHDMYVAINHRNHLSVLSGKVDKDANDDEEDEPLAKGEYRYDFTDPDPAAGIRGGIIVSQGVRVLPGGDAKGDNGIDEQDLVEIFNAVRTETKTDYLQQDVDLTANMTPVEREFVDRNVREAALRGINF